MNIWVTGCSGFLGKRLTRHFSEQGHVVFGLSRQSCADVESRSVDLAHPRAIGIVRSLVDERGRPDVVIHAAAKQPGSGELAEFFDSNVRSTANLVEALDTTPPRQIVFTSTLSVYGRTTSLPVNEKSPAGGSLSYGATKRWAEQLLESFQKRANIIVLRLPSLFGLGQRDSFIDGLARIAQRNEPIELFSQGELIRDALHVDDVVKAIDSVVAHPPGEQFALLNLGCGRAIKTIDYARELVRALNSNSDIVPVERDASQFDLYADITEARTQIGFEPMSLSQSMDVYANELRT